jgi:hypothetical protein
MAFISRKQTQVTEIIMIRLQTASGVFSLWVLAAKRSTIIALLCSQQTSEIKAGLDARKSDGGKSERPKSTLPLTPALEQRQEKSGRSNI